MIFNFLPPLLLTRALLEARGLQLMHVGFKALLAEVLPRHQVLLHPEQRRRLLTIGAARLLAVAVESAASEAALEQLGNQRQNLSLPIADRLREATFVRRFHLDALRWTGGRGAVVDQ